MLTLPSHNAAQPSTTQAQVRGQSTLLSEWFFKKTRKAKQWWPQNLCIRDADDDRLLGIFFVLRATTTTLDQPGIGFVSLENWMAWQANTCFALDNHGVTKSQPRRRQL